ncbi:MAG: histidine--tRNA ligase [Acidobacteriota bacterium]|nr:histidine--tRNA ligase [Acidobacteriota bacterium]
MSSNANPARGMRDFLPADVRRREYVIGVIKQIYESYGFEPLETPAVENLETLMGKYGEEGNQLIFKILKRGEKLDVNDKQLADLALRYDLTVPLARVVANYRNDLPKFFKRYQIQPVWRADRPARGRFREFYQCDVDAIGSKSMIVEAEIISAAAGILRRLGFEDFEVRLNHRELLREMLNASGIAENLQNDALVALDKLDKIGSEGVSKEMTQRGIGADASAKLLEFFAGLGEAANDNEFILSAIKKLVGDETKSLEDLRQILALADNSRIKIDPSLARGLSYYTGAIMEIVLTGGDFAGSIGGGGRYDELIGMFGKEQIPACGFSLGLERIVVVMTERNMFPENLQNASAADVLVTVWNEDAAGESLKLASELRSEGLRALVYPEADKLGKQFKYASQINAPFVCVLGETELAENKVTLKNMQSGEQETVSREEIAAKIGKQK